ncbi:MAG: hypothetical protein MjAS7_0995 [Metallosphaera javensis (ex Sakai et al. 2022)]|nr:MAG: hypothetical protein MjAS7_0995 [Metallosphaera javensis (ex Sakai et al. 2022)]
MNHKLLSISNIKSCICLSLSLYIERTKEVYSYVHLTTYEHKVYYPYFVNRYNNGEKV